MPIEYKELFELLQKPDWEETLYDLNINITYSADARYFLLKYNDLSADFSNPIVRACRGSIFETRTHRCVCAPFVKFCNYGEDSAAVIDYSHIRVLEKIDGSLMKVWADELGWHLSTNGSVDAFSTYYGDHTFGEIFCKALPMPYAEWTKLLNPNYTYMFELTSPLNIMTIKHKEFKIWFLSRRNILTMEEDEINDTLLSAPPAYDVHDFDSCLEVVTKMNGDFHEGVVVCDSHYNRLKIKNNQYLYNEHLVNNHNITNKRVAKMFKAGTLDDFLAYCPEHQEKVSTFLNCFHDAETRLAFDWRASEKYQGDIKTFAAFAEAHPESRVYLFNRYHRTEAYTPAIFLSQLPIDSLLRQLKLKKET